MDDTSGLRSLGSFPDGPLPNLISTGGEEAAQVQALAHGGDDLRQRGPGAKSLAFFIDGSIVLEASKAILKRDRERDNRVTSRVGLNPFSHFGNVLVLLANIIPLAEVDEVDNRLGGEEEEWVNDLDLVCQTRVSKDTAKIKRSYTRERSNEAFISV